MYKPSDLFVNFSRALDKGDYDFSFLDLKDLPYDYDKEEFEEGAKDYINKKIKKVIELVFPDCEVDSDKVLLDIINFTGIRDNNWYLLADLVHMYERHKHIETLLNSLGIVDYVYEELEGTKIYKAFKGCTFLTVKCLGDNIEVLSNITPGKLEGNYDCDNIKFTSPCSNPKHMFRRFVYEVRGGNTDLSFLGYIENIHKIKEEECVSLLHKVHNILYPNDTDLFVDYITNSTYYQLLYMLSDLVQIYSINTNTTGIRLTPLELSRCAYDDAFLSMDDFRNIEEELLEW